LVYQVRLRSGRRFPLEPARGPFSLREGTLAAKHQPHLMTTSPDLTPASADLTQAKQPLRVLVVDDHPIFRHGVTALVNAQEDFTICGAAATAESALEEMRVLQPDLAIVDVALGGTNGIELVKLMLAEQPDLRIAVVSMHEEALYALRALRAGAGAYIRKQEAGTQLLEALRTVCKGESYVSSQFREQLAFKTLNAEEHGTPSPIDKLSDREMEVLQHLGHGASTRDIAQTLNLSVKTVETHRAHIKEKLNFRDSGSMVRFAIDWIGQQSI